MSDQLAALVHQVQVHLQQNLVNACRINSPALEVCPTGCFVLTIGYPAAIFTNHTEYQTLFSRCFHLHTNTANVDNVTGRKRVTPLHKLLNALRNLVNCLRDLQTGPTVQLLL